MCSDIIGKEIEGSITKTSIKKLKLRSGVYECRDAWVLKLIMDPVLFTSYLKT